MQKKIITLFVIITIIYTIIGALLFLNIQLMQSPEVIIEIEAKEINSEEAILQTTINIDNPNGFEIVTKGLEIVTTTQDGYEVSRVKLEGGTVPANGKKTYSKEVNIAFNGHNPEQLTSKITGEVGFNILFIQKTISLNMGVVTSMKSIIDSFAGPKINITTGIENITQEGVELAAVIDVYNPNTFDMFLEDATTEIKTETGKKVGIIKLTGGTIPAKGSLQLKSQGNILFEALNAEMLIVKMSGTAGAEIAGFTKNISLGAEARITVPDLEELLFSKGIPTKLSIRVDRKVNLRGSVNTVIMSSNNSGKLDLVLKNTTVRLFTVDNEKHKVFGEAKIEEERILKAGEVTTFSCEIVKPWSEIFPISLDDLTQDWFLVQVTSRATIKGIDQSLHIQINGYQDVHPFR